MGDSGKEETPDMEDVVARPPGLPHTVEVDHSVGPSAEEEEAAANEVEADRERLASLQFDMEIGPMTDFVDNG